MSSGPSNVVGTIDHGGLAGDQLYFDLDLSTARLPAGSRLQIGEAIIDVTAKPQRGCAKFAARYGSEALRLVNTGEGRELNLRGATPRWWLRESSGATTLSNVPTATSSNLTRAPFDVVLARGPT
jgi:hypothetical protein